MGITPILLKVCLGISLTIPGPQPQGRAGVSLRPTGGPAWRDPTAAYFAGMRRNVVVDGRRILRREAMKGVELHIVGG